MNLLTINAGSSSIKFAIFESSVSLKRLISGKIECIGSPAAKLVVTNHITQSVESFFQSNSTSNYLSAIALITDWLKKEFSQRSIAAISHRVVHGGALFTTPQIISPLIMAELRRLSPIDPEHLPNELLLIEALQHQFPELNQIACFDTAFHSPLPRVAQMLTTPRRYEANGLRRYGFHGLSYAFLMQKLHIIAGDKVANGRVILGHLGNGVSLAAVSSGQPVDTSMGFTPSSGVAMSTRAGDMDPGLCSYLMRSEGLNTKQFNHLVNFESGLLGISETSSDMSELLRIQHSDYRASEAISLFCYQIKKQIGAYAAAMGGLDTLVFSGGIGENSPEIRSRICDGLEFLGIQLDAIMNLENALMVSSNSARIPTYVIPTDEEQMMASMMQDVLNGSD